jgi:hypothetical protein
MKILKFKEFKDSKNTKISEQIICCDVCLVNPCTCIKCCVDCGEDLELNPLTNLCINCDTICKCGCVDCNCTEECHCGCQNCG